MIRLLSSADAPISLIESRPVAVVQIGIVEHGCPDYLNVEVNVVLASVLAVPQYLPGGVITILGQRSRLSFRPVDTTLSVS